MEELSTLNAYWIQGKLNNITGLFNEIVPQKINFTML